MNFSTFQAHVMTRRGIALVCFAAAAVAAAVLWGCVPGVSIQKGTATGAVTETVTGAVTDTVKAAVNGASAELVSEHDSKSTAIGDGLKVLGGYVWSKNMEDQKHAIEQATVGTGIVVTQTTDNQLKLAIPNEISFDSGRHGIKPKLRSILDQLAQGLAQQPSTEMHIIGHTDNVGNEASNNLLSVNRAQSARDYLVKRGVSLSQMTIDGRGAGEPIADNSTEAGRARNRRIEIFLAERGASR